jgi:hypothetical protein
VGVAAATAVAGAAGGGIGVGVAAAVRNYTLPCFGELPPVDADVFAVEVES